MAMRKLPATIAASTAQPHPGVLRSPGIGKCCQKSLTGTFFPPCWSPAGASTGPLDGGHMEAFVRGVSTRKVAPITRSLALASPPGARDR